jgi:hypothetical protein
MRRTPEMPFALALAASALIHVAALLGPGWTLPGTNEPEQALMIDAVLAKPAPRPEAAPVAKPAPKPAAERPRPLPVLAAAAAESAAAGAPAVSAPSASPAIAAPVPTVVAPAAPSPVRIALPGKGRVRYVITRGEGGFVVGQSVHSWEHDGLAYTLQSVTETTGLAALFKPARVLQLSRGEVTVEGLRPVEFRHERVGGLDTAAFDWGRRVVAYAGREEAIDAGTQDMLSMYYQIVLLSPRSGELDMPIATGRKLEVFRIEVLGEEVVTLPAGGRRALHLKTRSGNDSIELWIAPEARGLPLKIRFTDRKGEIFDQLADEIDIQEKQ